MDLKSRLGIGGMGVVMFGLGCGSKDRPSARRVVEGSSSYDVAADVVVAVA